MNIGKGLSNENINIDDMLNQKQLGERIKLIRKNKKMTQKELGEMIGKKEITIRKYENGGITPTLEVLTKISKALDIPIRELVVEEGKTHIFDKDTGKHFTFDTPFVEEDYDAQLKITNFSAEINTALNKYLAIVSPNGGEIKANKGKTEEICKKILDLIEYETYKEKNNKK